MAEIRVRVVVDITHANGTDTSVERSALLRVGDNPAFLGRESHMLIDDVASEVVGAINHLHGQRPEQGSDEQMAPGEPRLVPVFIVFDGLPGQVGPHFVEVEDECGHSIATGADWGDHPMTANLRRLGPFYIQAGGS